MSGYSSEDGNGFIILTICALILGALIEVKPVSGVGCVTVTGIKAAPMLPSGRQNFEYYEKEGCDKVYKAMIDAAPQPPREDSREN